MGSGSGANWGDKGHGAYICREREETTYQMGAGTEKEKNLRRGPWLGDFCEKDPIHPLKREARGKEFYQGME